MSTISTHVLDTSRGLPAEGMSAFLCRLDGEDWQELASGRTDADGRWKDVLPKGKQLVAGVYRLRFETGPYFAMQGRDTFYPYADIVFQVTEGVSHYHVPLLISGWGFSTYRGS